MKDFIIGIIAIFIAWAATIFIVYCLVNAGQAKNGIPTRERVEVLHYPELQVICFVNSEHKSMSCVNSFEIYSEGILK